MATISRGFNNLGAIAATIQPFVEDTLDHGVVTLIEVADPLTRVDTGALRANKSMTKSAGLREVQWNQSYSAYQNYGTYKMEGTHFATIGADAAQDVIDTRLAQWEGSL